MGHVSSGQGVAGSKELKSARAALDRAINLPEVCPRGRLAGAEPFTGAPRVYPVLGREAAFCGMGHAFGGRGY
jgi:hypothetical protein